IPAQQVLEARVRARQSANALDIARGKWLALGLSQESLAALLQEGSAKAVATLPIRSPLTGTVIHADLSVGRVVEPAEHLFEIVDLSSVWVQIGILEKDLRRVQVGQR